MPRSPQLIKDTWSPIGHSIICPKYGPLVDTKRHCHNMARYFYSQEPYFTHSSASWFHLASGITEVTYISDLYDNLVEWCGPAIEYEDAKSKFHSKLIRELTRFNFIWGGFEAFCDSLNLPSCPDSRKRGIVNNINYKLKLSYESAFPPLLFYEEIIQHFKTLISKNDWYGNANDLFAVDNCTSKNLIGLKIVYKIRNSFAHGAFQFSEPDGWHHVKPYDISIIICSCRILLMTIQMLLLCSEQKLNFKVAQLHQSEEYGVGAKTFLQKMHLKSFRHS